MGTSPRSGVWCRSRIAVIRDDIRIVISTVVDVNHVDRRHKRTHTTVEIVDALLWGARRHDTSP